MHIERFEAELEKNLPKSPLVLRYWLKAVKKNKLVPLLMLAIGVGENGEPANYLIPSPDVDVRDLPALLRRVADQLEAG